MSLPVRSRFLALGFAVVLLVAAQSSRASLVNFSNGLMAYVEKRWGPAAPPRLRAWQRLVRDNKKSAAPGQSDEKTLKLVNDFWNQVPFVTDWANWGVEDYWATPVEMLGSFGGDCEDYCIGKYESLKDIGVPITKLRIIYVRALKLGEAHMVLAYYPTPDADPLILDNLIDDIRPASQRTDLEPVYSFNDDDLWFGVGALPGGASNVRFWRDLLEKLAKEQAM